ncbi:MAG: sulfatase [Bryobacter sp.]|nr:sulfatase [Bryobacter sp.]
MPNAISRRRALAAVAAPAILRGAQAPLPNLMLVLSDDHSMPDLGCMGNPDIRTPNLDRFASQGMKLQRMFTAAPQCVPSRSAYLTGRSPVANRMGRFASPLPADIPALPELLRPRGYYTGVAGRYFHLDGQINPTELTQEIYARHNLKSWSKRVDFLHVGAQRDQFVPVFEKFLNQAQGKPWFYWFNFSDPHHVWDRNAIPTPHDPSKLRMPKHLLDSPGMRGDLARHYDEIARMDSDFGKLMEKLEARGLRENTLVLFAGDNGRAFPHGKGSLYDPGLHVPALVRWPGKIRAGSSSQNLLSGEDVTPTFLEAAGLSPLKAMSGESFLKLLQGDASYRPRQHVFAARLPHGNSNYTPETKASTFDLSRSARSATHKLIWNYTPYQEYSPVDSARDEGWQSMVAAHQAGKLAPELEKAYFTRPRPVVELYDLRNDPDELNNVAGRPEHAAAEEALKQALQEKMVTDFDFLPPPFNEAMPRPAAPPR